MGMVHLILCEWLVVFKDCTYYIYREVGYCLYPTIGEHRWTHTQTHESCLYQTRWLIYQDHSYSLRLSVINQGLRSRSFTLPTYRILLAGDANAWAWDILCVKWMLYCSAMASPYISADWSADLLAPCLLLSITVSIVITIFYSYFLKLEEK